MHYLQLTLLLLVMAGPVRGGSKDTLPRFPNKSGTNTNKHEEKNPPISKTDGGQSGGVTQAMPRQDLFRRSHDGWSACERRTGTSCGASLQNISCVYIPENRQVPTHFCDSLPSPESTFRPCDDTCPEDCVMTAWSAWTPCSSTCSPATRYRTRRVLTTARNSGQECGELSESEPCTELDGCEFEVHLPTYTWKIGEWSSCRQVSQLADGRGCGIGRRLRSISCVSSRGEIVDNDQCLENQDPRKKASQPPPVAACSLPCDCRTSTWSAWGPCSETCRHRSGPVRTGLQTRTREIQTLPENGGVPCPNLMEQRECQGDILPECPRFEWIAEEWQRCTLTLDNEGLCGAGRQRRQVYCIQEGDEGYIPVSEEACITSPVNSSLHQPPMKRACWVDCPVDCQLGQWQNWSPCSKSCEEGVQIRSREVLVAAAFGGEECGPLAEAKECEFVECAWWHTSRWTSCKLNHGLTDCGSGLHARVLYCMSALDQVVDDEFCPGSEPPWQETCKIPCPTDCVISEWSDWGPCSKTCGKKGGMQMRSRQILAYSDLEEDSCLPETELTQYRPCNLHLSCQTYTWQVGAWGECSVNGTAAGECDRGAGIQYRVISCEKESGVAQDDSFCDRSSKPAGVRSCEAPCPVDCKLSPWSSLSECSQTCGVDGHRIRSQRIVQLSANGGASCPSVTNEDGVIFKLESCDHLPPCYSYRWNAGNWSECEVLGVDCGKGLQTREVHCGRSDGTTVEPGVCVREVLSTPPPSHQQCILPCAGDCLLSDWSVFGPCIHSCGLTPHSGYCRMQSRTIISIDPATDNAEELCPHITTNDLMNYVPCDDPSFTYEWLEGPWQSCLLNEGDECGGGVAYRSVLCMRSDSTLVPQHFCGSSAAAPPISQAACDVPCVIDCVVSEWMEWSPCTQACGRGLRTRMRDIQQQSANGGQGCPPLIDSMICIEMMCDNLEWEVSEWGSCEVMDPRSNCGRGAQVRTVSCKAGESYEPECGKRFPRPDNSRHCVLPCPGDCVMSNWQNSSPCPTPCQRNSTKFQVRSVIRHPTTAGEQCGDLTQTTPCSESDCVGSGYRLVTGEWSRCKAVSGECGSGTRHRVTNCINDDGFTVAEHHCPDQNITTADLCRIPCPPDCEPKRFSDWSACNATCGLLGVMERSRVVEGQSMECSEKWTMRQTKPCNAAPCHTYTWNRSFWSECRFETEPGCGIGERTRLVECERSDGLTVDHEYCILQDYPDASRQGVLNQILSSVNETLLDIHTSQRCDKSCPGDCLVTSWSAETSCLKSCYSVNDPAFITSSRSVTSPAMAGGKPCPVNLIQKRSCLKEQALCPNYTWQTGAIIGDTRTREIWCQIQDNGAILNVTGGCIESLRPASSLECDPQCTASGAICQEGKCHCKKGYEGDGQACLPVSGCVTDDHCPLPDTYCNRNGQCGCRSGFMLDRATNLCAESNLIPDGNGEADSSPTSLVPNNGNDVEQFEGKSDIWKWVVVASVVAIAFLVVIIGVFYIRRRRVAEVGFNPIPTISSDSDFPLSKMVKDVVTKC